jgi:hypothetical protein
MRNTEMETMTTAVFALREIKCNDKLLNRHQAAGGIWIRQFIARLHNGFLRVILSVEPTHESGGKREMHLSISFCKTLSGNSGPRLPTDEECREIRHQLQGFVAWFGEFEEEPRTSKEPIRQFWNPKFQ